MWKIRYYVPLLGFVVPTVVIGYGVVIPRSPIAGVNELTVGFATTIVGAVVTYIAGIRAALRTACPVSMPWRVRLGRYINRQAAAPRGLFGRLLGLIWRFEHQKVNRKTLDLLELTPSHRVLEVGCGPGRAVREAAMTASHVVGVDVSETMLAVARKRNASAIEQSVSRFSTWTAANWVSSPNPSIARFQCTAFTSGKRRIVSCRNSPRLFGWAVVWYWPSGRTRPTYRTDSATRSIASTHPPT